jgi:uncharacterized protein YbjT (DUF2867 family)
MIAITGITGQVGGVVARTLLAAGKSVRAVVRDAAKGETWARLGCEAALARMDDLDALKQAFAGAEGVFVILPPNYDPSPGFSETRQIVATARLARGCPTGASRRHLNGWCTGGARKLADSARHTGASV